jgi:hypothetical protein
MMKRKYASTFPCIKTEKFKIIRTLFSPSLPAVWSRFRRWPWARF